MNGKPQLIPGIVRKATVNKPTTISMPTGAPSVKLQKGIIPGSIRPIAAKTCVNTKPVAAPNISAASVHPISSIDQLTNQAVEEILRETKLGKLRAEQHGATAWRPCPLRKTNKHFLNRTLISAVHHNDRVKKKTTRRSRLKLSELVRNEKDEELDDAGSSSPKVKRPDTATDSDSSKAVVNLIEDSD
uniref:Uncharacterized protein n=1 Tax=Anopheles dirus TaxID=7168 RepID=A0A182NUT0_9DIPT